MAVKHSKVTAVPDDPAFDVGSDEWNAAHTIDAGTITNAQVASLTGTLWVNVKDPAYGATGDGSTDDTAALLAAVAAVPTGGVTVGGRIVLPPGVYVTNKPLYLPDKTNMEGASAGGSPVVRVGASFPTATLAGSLALPAATVPTSAMHANFPTAGGVFSVLSDAGLQFVTYTGISGNNFTGCVGGTGTAANLAVIGSPVLVAGTPYGAASGVFGCMVKNFQVDLASAGTNVSWIAGSTGYYSNRLQENSGWENFGVLHSGRNAVRVENAASGITAQNWRGTGLYITHAATSSEATSVHLSVDGNGQPHRGIWDTTVSGSASATAGTVGALLRGFTGEFSKCQIERVTEAVVLDNSGASATRNLAPVLSAIFGATCTTVVHVKTVAGFDKPYTMLGVRRNHGNTTNLVVDDETGYTITDDNMSWYFVGGKVTGSRNVLSDVTTVPTAAQFATKPLAHSVTSGQTANDHHNQAHTNTDHTTTGTPGSSALGDAAAQGASASVARLDHVHGREAAAITTSGHTQATGKMLGRSTAATGAIEEITVGAGLSLSAGSLTASGSGALTTLDSVAALSADSGTTDNAPLITTYLAGQGAGTFFLGNHAGNTYGIKQPVIIRNGQSLVGMGSMQGGTTLQLASGFPTTTTTGGSQVTPVDTTTTFTLNVAATAAFPMAAGKVNPAGGIGVLCMSPASGPAITVFYTGLTSTTFTGCRVGASDVSVTIPNGANVSTFAVWLTDPGDTNGGFGTRIENLSIDINDAAAGASGIHSSHVQEGGGGYNLRIFKPKCFGVRIDAAPASSSSVQAVNYAFEKMWIIASSTAEAGYVTFDEMHSYVGTHTVRLDAQRGLKDVTFTTQGSATALGYAGLRINAGTGSYSDLHLECQNVGIMVGDVYASAPTISNVWIGGTWGPNTGNNGGIYVANISTNSAVIKNVGKSGSAAGLRVIVDGVNTQTVTTNTVSSYVVHPDGTYELNDAPPHSSTTGITATDHHAAPAAGPDADITIDAAGAAGTASTFARSGHGHKVATSSGTPAAVGTAAAGTSGHSPSRDDHVHATGAGTPTTQAFGDAAATGSGPAAAMTDHKHGMPANPAPSFATPAIVLGSSAAAGAAGTVIRSDGTIAAFDATNPTTQALNDAAAVGTAAFAARRDHKHAMFANSAVNFASLGDIQTGVVTSDFNFTTSSTTLQSITGLTFNISSSATEIWFVEVIMDLHGANITMDSKFAFTVPASCTGRWGMTASANGIAATAVSSYHGVPSGNTPTTLVGLTTAIACQSGANTDYGAGFWAKVYGGGSSGAVQLQGAQNTGDGGQLTALKGCFLRATRIAT